jgi:hypothetical protein
LLQRCGATSQGLLAALVSHAGVVQVALRGERCLRRRRCQSCRRRLWLPLLCGG